MYAQFMDLLAVVLFLYLNNKLSCGCRDCWLGFRLVYENLIPTSVLKVVPKDSKHACIFACKFEAHCVAVAFHQQRRRCHLYTRNVEELNTDPDSGMMVFMLIIDGSNLASLKSPSTSSIGTLQPPTAALDNNPNTCFQTEKDDYQPWFLVDLLDTFLIRLIVVHHKADYPERLHDVNYEVYDSDPTINNSSEANCCASVDGYSTGQNIVRCNKGVHGRFVKISIEKSNFLTLCGVEIYGTPMNEVSDNISQRYKCNNLPEGDNIALGKPTTQSSVFYSKFPSALAVDGNKNGHFAEGVSCQHTAGNDVSPWWQVDLEWTYDITSLTISNRYDGKRTLGKRFSDVSVMVYDSDPSVGNPTPKLCIFLPGVFGCTVRTFECDQKTIGRFIRISKPTANLHMCEVEVTGIKQ